MVTWQGRETVLNSMDAYGRKVEHTAEQVARYWAPQLEASAKSSAPWTDQTGNARQALHTTVEVEDKKAVLYLSHGVEYGLWLEVKAGGQWSILWPTIQEYLPRIRQMLKQVFGVVR